MAVYDYDLFVIGAGSGGIRAARTVAREGFRVGVAEYSKLGGTCVNLGCIPKKLYFYSSHFSEDFEDSHFYGWNFGENQPTFNWKRLQSAKDHEIHRLNQVYEKILRDSGAELICGFASLINEHTIQIEGASSRRVTAEKILLAVGSRPSLPDIPGKELVVTSDYIFQQQELPSRIVIVGGGYIAVEFACIFSGLGCEVSLLYRGDLFLRHFDQSIRLFFLEEIKKKGVKLFFHTQVTRLSKNEDGSICCSFHQEGTEKESSEITTDQVIYAIGRLAKLEQLGLENAGVSCDSRGCIEIDDDFQTSTPSIFALGDAVGRVQLTPVAIAEAVSFVRKHFLGQKSLLDYRYIPTAVFSRPSIASVGFTEEEAREKLGEIQVYSSSFHALKQSLKTIREKTFIKLITEKKTDRVVGAHIIGEDAGEIIQGVSIAMKARATKQVFDETIGIHPSVAEEFTTL